MRAERFYLGAEQGEPGLEGFLDKEVVTRLAIIDDQLEAVIGLRVAGFCRRFCHSQQRSLSARGSRAKCPYLEAWMPGDGGVEANPRENLSWTAKNLRLGPRRETREDTTFGKWLKIFN